MKIVPEVDCCRLLRGGLSAMVLCKEKVEGAGVLMATNVFEKSPVDGKWRMVSHQAGGPISPTASFPSQSQ